MKAVNPGANFRSFNICQKGENAIKKLN